MKVNERATLYARKEIVVQAAPETIWRNLTDIDHWSEWYPAVSWSKLDGPLTAGSTFQWKTGGLELSSALEIIETNQQIGWTGRGLGTRAQHLWRLQSHDNGTLLVTEESMDGWLVSVMRAFMPNLLANSLETWLQAVKRKSELASS